MVHRYTDRKKGIQLTLRSLEKSYPACQSKTLFLANLVEPLPLADDVVYCKFFALLRQPSLARSLGEGLLQFPIHIISVRSIVNIIYTCLDPRSSSLDKPVALSGLRLQAFAFFDIVLQLILTQ